MSNSTRVFHIVLNASKTTLSVVLKSVTCCIAMAKVSLAYVLNTIFL